MIDQFEYLVDQFGVLGFLFGDGAAFIGTDMGKVFQQTVDQRTACLRILGFINGCSGQGLGAR